ncbi:MAG: Hsp20/alpha crystallin family protein [Mycobacterium sp.]
MPGSRPNVFEGVTDYFTELTRLRTLGIHGGSEAERTHASAWVPVTDIFAKGDDLVIRVELAGVDPDEVALSFSRGALTISGNRRRELPEGIEFLTQERFYGEFRRLITLPKETRAEQVSSVLDRGLLEITVQGALGSAQAAAQRIEVVARSQEATAPAVQSDE